jgi:Kef-type K+ transport system membrane component KefB/Trk K+ transport system NAD-binding subunit
MHDPFLQTSLILLLSVVFGGLGLLLRQPLLVTFIGVGILCGPDALGLVEESEVLELLADLGIALLLFVVGLKLDVKMIRTMGPVALSTGLGQVFFTVTIGFALVLLLGFPWLPALYIAVALTFSSTIIIIKLLTDKREIDALHGRIAVGFLIVQDLLVVVALILLSGLSGTGAAETTLWLEMVKVGISGVVFLGFILVLMRWVMPGLMKWVAHNTELLILFSVAWAVGLAVLGGQLGFSHEVGAFLAGMSLASTPFRDSIGNRLTSLRDFLLLFFFIQLGSTLDLGILGGQVGPAILLSVFVLIGNPLIVMVIMGAMGYRKRTGFLAGLAVAQISEFSLVLAALGVSVGHLSQEGLGLITLVGLVTITLSTYMILYSQPIYNRISPWLSIFERKIPYAEKKHEETGSPERTDVILFGIGRFGNQIAQRLLLRGRRILGVDFDPAVVTNWRAEGRQAVYGDIDDPDLLEHLPLQSAPWVVIAIPFRPATPGFLENLRRAGFKGKVAVTIAREEQADVCRKAGADLLLRLFSDAAEQAVDGLTGTTEAIHKAAPWPVGMREVRVPSDSLLAGKRLRELTLRADTGASIVAVSRAGRSLFDPGADFQIFPGDRLVLVGDELALDKAREYALRPLAAADNDSEEEAGFRMDCITVEEFPHWAGRTIAGLGLRKHYGLTVVSLKRGEEVLNAPGPELVLEPEDQLFAVGREGAVDALRRESVDQA